MSYCQGLFVGLTTLDLIYRAAQPPTTNQKIVASDYTIAAGGPATNAAIAFAHLGNRATVLSVVGNHPTADLLLADLQQRNVEVSDLMPHHPEPPAISSIIVTEATGERAVVSVNATRTPASTTTIPVQCLQGMDVVMIDGHQMAVGRAIAQQAKVQGIPVVIDGGSWKPGFETVLPFVDYAICSANFQPPACLTAQQTVAYLQFHGISHVAITQGAQPVLFWQPQQAGTIPVPQVQAIDTLGAGDVFHGAFCHAILHEDFVDALATAAKIAARSCKFFGTRAWMDEQ